MARSIRSLDEVKRSIEQSLTEHLESTRSDGGERPAREADTSADPDASARAAGRQLVDVCNKSALDIQRTGEAVVKVAEDISAETQALAELLRKHGVSIAARIEEFTAMTRRVADQVDAARTQLLSAAIPGAPPPESASEGSARPSETTADDAGATPK
jgi:hypothetical protein